MSENANVSAESGMNADPMCGRPCDGSQPSIPYPQARDTRGRWLKGNVGAVTHGLRAENVPPEFAHLAAAVERFVAGCVSDEGDPDVPTRRKALLEYRARLHRRIVQLDAALELRGLFDKRGKLRVAWLQRLEGLVGAAKALDTLLGLERGAKRVPSLAEYLSERSAPAPENVGGDPAC